MIFYLKQNETVEVKFYEEKLSLKKSLLGKLSKLIK